MSKERKVEPLINEVLETASPFAILSLRRYFELLQDAYQLTEKYANEQQLDEKRIQLLLIALRSFIFSWRAFYAFNLTSTYVNQGEEIAQMVERLYHIESSKELIWVQYILLIIIANTTNIRFTAIIDRVTRRKETQRPMAVHEVYLYYYLYKLKRHLKR